ncbi:acetyltransferase [Bifidobacterium ramosum]|nr:acetyltransferase [Bifidobacterium ramosum]
MILVQYPQTDCGAAIRDLERMAWDDGGQDGAFPSAPDTYDTSFVWMDGDVAVCHVGIRKTEFLHRGQRYLAYGLSEVVTRPEYRRRGLATTTIRRAARYIADRRPDLSVFTCEPDKIPLYERGGWNIAKDVCLVGGTRERPFRSDSLHLATMIRLLSPRAKAHAADFEHADIVLELGEGQLW